MAAPAVRLILGVAAIAAGAQVAFTLPGTSIPQTAQTFAVVAVAAVLGPKAGAAAAAIYLACGALGLPVFASFGSGVDRLAGPAGGFLAAFPLAAWWAGARVRAGRARRFLPALAVMAAAHGLVLALGWARLALALGPAAAFERGVAPFLAGAMVKSAAAALVAMAASPAPPAGQGAAGSRPTG